MLDDICLCFCGELIFFKEIISHLFPSFLASHVTVGAVFSFTALFDVLIWRIWPHFHPCVEPAMDFIFSYVFWQKFPCRLDACLFVPASVGRCFFRLPGHFTLYAFSPTCMPSSQYACLLYCFPLLHSCSVDAIHACYRRFVI